MIKHTETILRQQPSNCLSVFDHFVGLALEGLTYINYVKTKEKGWLGFKGILKRTGSCQCDIRLISRIL